MVDGALDMETQEKFGSALKISPLARKEALERGLEASGSQLRRYAEKHGQQHIEIVRRRAVSGFGNEQGIYINWLATFSRHKGFQISLVMVNAELEMATGETYDSVFVGVAKECVEDEVFAVIDQKAKIRLNEIYSQA